MLARTNRHKITKSPQSSFESTMVLPLLSGDVSFLCFVSFRSLRVVWSETLGGGGVGSGTVLVELLLVGAFS